MAEGAVNATVDARTRPALLRSALRLDRRVAAQLLQLVGGAGIGYAILLAATPIVTRLYPLEDFGVYGLFASVVSVLAVFATAKYDFAIVSAKTRGEAAYLTIGCLALAAIVSTASAVVIGLLSRLEVFGFGALSPVACALLAPTVFLTAAFLTFRQYAVRDGCFADVSRSLAAQGLAKSAVQIGFGASALLTTGLLAAEAAGRAIACGVCVKSSWSGLRSRLRGLRWKRVAWALSRNDRFPRHGLPSSVLDTVTLNFPGPAILFLYGLEIGGAYMLIWRVLVMPINLLGRSVSDVFHRRLAQCERRGDGSGLRLLDRTAARLLAMGALPVAVLWLFGERAISWALGPQWDVAGQMAASLAPWMLAQFVVVPLAQTMSVYRAYDIKLIYDCFCLVASVASLLLVASFGGSHLLAISVLSAANTAAYGLFYALLRIAVVRRSPAK